MYLKGGGGAWDVTRRVGLATYYAYGKGLKMLYTARGDLKGQY